MAKSEREVKSLMENPFRNVEKKIGFKIRNPREMNAIKHALKWAYNLKDKDEQKDVREWS